VALSEVFSGTVIEELAEAAREMGKSKSITYDI